MRYAKRLFMQKQRLYASNRATSAPNETSVGLCQDICKRRHGLRRARAHECFAWRELDVKT